jgi:hypothetical protein
VRINVTSVTLGRPRPDSAHPCPEAAVHRVDSACPLAAAAGALVDGVVASPPMFGSRMLARVAIASTIAVAAVLAFARPAVRADALLFPESVPPPSVLIISPANGGAAPGQTIEAGVFTIINKSAALVSISSVTISFSNSSLFSSATLNPPAAGPIPSNVSPVLTFVPQPGPVTASPPTSSTTFTFNPPFAIGPGGEPFFGLTVKLSPLSRNDTSGFAYAGVTEFTAAGGASVPLWMAFAMLGLALAALPGRTRRRIWLLAGLMILLAAGAPGCGSDSSGPSSTQTVTAVSAVPTFGGVVVRTIGTETVTGLPLKLGTITGH